MGAESDVNETCMFDHSAPVLHSSKNCKIIVLVTTLTSNIFLVGDGVAVVVFVMGINITNIHPNYHFSI